MRLPMLLFCSINSMVLLLYNPLWRHAGLLLMSAPTMGLSVCTCNKSCASLMVVPKGTSIDFPLFLQMILIRFIAMV